MHSMSTLYLSKAWRQGTFWERSHKFCRSSSFKSNGDHRHNRPNIFKDSRKGMPRTISWSTVSCSIFSTRLPVLNGFCSLWPTRDSATSSTCTWAKHGNAWQRGNGQCALNHCDCMAAQIHPCDRHVTRLNNPNFSAFTCWVRCASSTLSFSFSSNLWVTTSFGMSSLCSQHFWRPWPMAKPHQSHKTRPPSQNPDLMRNRATKKRLHDEQLTNGSPVISHWMDRISGSYGVLWKAATPHIT